MSRTIPAFLAALFAVILTAAPDVHGQVILLSGNVFDGQGGPLAPNTVYRTNIGFTVPAGQTLTVSAGAIIKFAGGTSLSISGTLLVNGTAPSPAIFTSLEDDSVGGDTGGNGPSVGAPGDWFGISFSNTSDASALTRADIRFAGRNGASAVALASADIILSDCVIHDCQNAGLDVSNGALSFPTVSNGAFVDNGGIAIIDVAVESLPGFTNNTATGNGGNYMRMTFPALGANTTVSASSLLGGALVIATGYSIPAGATLTLQAGAVLKFETGTSFSIFGTLATAGTAQSPVVFTSFSDDSVAGDTNNNGPSAGAPGEWFGLSFSGTSDASALTRADIRFAGRNGASAVALAAADITLSDCVIRNCQNAALDVSNGALSFPTVSGCSLVNNGGIAIIDVAVETLPGFTNNTASGNAGNYMRMTFLTLGASTTFGPASLLGGALVMATGCSIPAGAALTLQAGAVLKFETGTSMSVFGTLSTLGTPSSPVVFTSFADDSIAGDTNNNGASAGTPGDWFGLSFSTTADASVLTRAEVRFGGRNGASAVALAAADITLADCVIRNCLNAGLDVSNGALSFPAVSGCAFVGNSGTAVIDVAVESLPGFTNNTATGNGGNYMRMTFSSLGADATVGPANLLGGALVMGTGLTVPAGTTLTLQPGAAFKWEAGLSMSVSGAIRCLGTGLEPVVFTELADDSVAGDTNGNGSLTAPSAGAWFGLSVVAGAAASVLDHLVIRYAGRNGLPAFNLASPALTARALRADLSANAGITASALSGPAHDWVAFRCGGAGINLTGGAIDVVHATAAHNTGAGIQRANPHTGSLRNSIAFASGGANFAGWTAGQVFSSCGGFAGQNGNIVADPLFADASAAGGDLGLLPGSPCLNSASLPDALAVVMDWRDASRVLDHALTGAMLPDMGAIERAAFTMAVAGIARLGDTVTLSVTGAVPGFSVYALGGLDGTLLVPPFGFVTCGDLATILVFPAIVPTGTPFPITVPPVPALVGFTVGVQTLTFDGSGQQGNITNLYRPTIRP